MVMTDVRVVAVSWPSSKSRTSYEFGKAIKNPDWGQSKYIVPEPQLI